jgi:hypothetical protein
LWFSFVSSQKNIMMHADLIYLRNFLLFFTNILFLIFFQQNDEQRRQITAQQKLIDKHKDNLQKCLNVNKSLLIEKVKYYSFFIFLYCYQFVSGFINCISIIIQQFSWAMFGIVVPMCLSTSDVCTSSWR